MEELRLEELRLEGFVGLAGDLIRLGKRNCSPIQVQLMFPSALGEINYIYVTLYYMARHFVALYSVN